MTTPSAEFRAQEIKTRRLQIAATLAGWKRDYFVHGIERTMAQRATLEAEDAELALELRVNGDAVVKARVARREREDACILKKLLEVLRERGLDDVITEANERAGAAILEGGAE